jgi:hypothetical protein
MYLIRLRILRLLYSEVVIFSPSCYKCGLFENLASPEFILI